MKSALLPLLLTATVITTASAQPRPGVRGPEGSPRHAARAMRLAEVLDLTDAQKARLAELRETQRAAIEPLREQQRANRTAIEAALAKGDANAAGTAMLANYRLRDQLKAAHENFRASLAGILTPEQQEKLELLKEMRDARKGRRGRR